MTYTGLSQDYLNQFSWLKWILAIHKDDPNRARELFLEATEPKKYRDMGYRSYPVTEENQWRVDELDRLADEVGNYIKVERLPTKRLDEIVKRTEELVNVKF